MKRKDADELRPLTILLNRTEWALVESEARMMNLTMKAWTMACVVGESSFQKRRREMEKDKAAKLREYLASVGAK